MASSPTAADDAVPLISGVDVERGAAPTAAHRPRRGALAAAATLAALGCVAALSGRARGAPALWSDRARTVQLAGSGSPPWDCSDDGDDCSQTQCCSRPGSQCYRKSAGGAWSCQPLRKRSPIECSWEGENCKTSGCCRRSGFKCFEKDANWGSCSDNCSSLSGADPEPWTCKVLGGDLGTRVIQKDLNNPAGTSLYCFAVVTPNGVTAPGVQEGYEKSIMDVLEKQKLGIYQCDGSDVFEGVRVSKGDWSSVVNTDIFLHVWHQVQAKAVYSKYDWTIKADVDAVFFPDRLRTHLVGLGPPADTPLYLHNINFRFHFMGALEVLSTKAVDVLLANFADCAKNLGRNGGEDYFTMQCLDASGVGHMTDFTLLDDKYQQGQGWNLFDISPCTNQAVVAFHPYKHVNSWQGCYKVATGINKPSDFVGCNSRWPGDACALNSTRHHETWDPQPSTGIVA